MGFASMLDFPFQKIPDKLPYFVLKNLNTEKIEVSLPSGSKIKITPKNLEVLGIPMGKKKVESNSPRDFNDEFLIAFKKQFEDKKYPTTTDLSSLIQRTINIDFMFQINYLTLFANCMINCDNTSRLKYHVIKNIKSSDIINDFDWCSFIWDHIKTSKIGWDDRKLQNWYNDPNTVLMLIYLHYTTCNGMVMISQKWPAIRNWTSKDATDREIFEMCQGRFGLVDVIEENEETENESEVKKRTLKELIYETIEAKFESVLKENRELEDMLKENMKMHELFYEDEKFELFVKKFIEEFTTGLNRDENKAGTSGARHGNDNDDVDYDGHCNDEDDVGHVNHGDVHANGNDEAAQKEKKEKAEKEATEKKKAKMQKASAKKKEQAEMQAAAEANEVGFDDGKRTIAHRKEMQSLAPGIEIEKQIIDTLVMVLNFEERIRTVGKDFRRRYFLTDAVADKDQAKKYESFENVTKNQMIASASKKKMKDIELAFFPAVVAAGQYYVIVFNLLKANAVILDNEKHDDYNKYKEVFDSVVSNF
nr:200 kDa antigen p200 [Tanacetum cinerariifolium]